MGTLKTILAGHLRPFIERVGEESEDSSLAGWVASLLDVSRSRRRSDMSTEPVLLLYLQLEYLPCYFIDDAYGNR